MKKGWKIAGAVAAIAALTSALIPYSINRDEENDETTAYALLWKFTKKPDSEGRRTISIDIGFHNPAEAEIDELLMGENDLILVDEPKCDIELTLEPKLDDEPEAPAQPEI